MLEGMVAEEEQRLALLGDGGDDAADVVNEAHVEHAIRLVEDEVGDAFEARVALLHEIEEAPRSRHEDIVATARRA